MRLLDELLQACAALHHHLCPRQVLGVRMGMLAGEILGLDLPQSAALVSICAPQGAGRTDRQSAWPTGHLRDLR